jgi:hypothetical protein
LLDSRQSDQVFLLEGTMSQWIVEGTRVASFRIALDLAQQQADRQQELVPLIRDFGDHGYVIVKMVSPRP